MKPNPLLRSIETAALFTDRVLVSFSGGKDSVCVIDLCMRYFKHVEAFFMYLVPGLSFQESICRYYEDKYSIPIYRIPHFMLSEWLRYGLFRAPDWNVPIISVKETYDYMREQIDIHWIAAGERIDDSLWRRGMIKSTGTIDLKRGRFYPIAEWRKKDVYAYIKQRKLRIGPESAKLGFSFRAMTGRDLLIIKNEFPSDYEKIKACFPLMEVSIINARMRGLIPDDKENKQQIPEV